MQPMGQVMMPGMVQPMGYGMGMQPGMVMQGGMPTSQGVPQGAASPPQPMGMAMQGGMPAQGVSQGAVASQPMGAMGGVGVQQMPAQPYGVMPQMPPQPIGGMGVQMNVQPMGMGVQPGMMYGQPMPQPMMMPQGGYVGGVQPGFVQPGFAGGYPPQGAYAGGYPPQGAPYTMGQPAMQYAATGGVQGVQGVPAAQFAGAQPPAQPGPVVPSTEGGFLPTTPAVFWVKSSFSYGKTYTNETVDFNQAKELDSQKFKEKDVHISQVTVYYDQLGLTGLQVTFEIENEGSKVITSGPCSGMSQTAYFGTEKGAYLQNIKGKYAKYVTELELIDDSGKSKLKVEANPAGESFDSKNFSHSEIMAFSGGVGNGHLNYIAYYRY